MKQQSRIHRAGFILACGLLLTFAVAGIASVPALASGYHKMATAGRASGPATRFGRPGVDYVPGQVLVTFKQKAEARSSRYTVQALGGHMKHAMASQPDTAMVRLGRGKSVAQAVQDYGNDPGVAHAQPNYIYHTMAVTPNDPGFDKLWGLHNTGQTVNGDMGTPGDDIGATKAWSYRTDCSNILVAVVDTGINYTQADLAGNMWDGGPKYPHHGYDTVDDDNDPMPVGGADHGTHVAGTIAAVGDNGKAVTGVCWKARIMSVRALGPHGGTSVTTVNGINFAVEHGARVLNLSFGTEGGDPPDLMEKKALENARSKGVIAVVSAGNAGQNVDTPTGVEYPCAFDLDNIICVAAVNQNYQLADFSNYGRKSVDVGAPGTNILSTYPGPKPESSDLTRWNRDPSWKVQKCAYPAGIELLTNPGDWCDPGATYAHQLDAVAYQSFDLSGSDVLGAGYSYIINFDIDRAPDAITVNHKAGSTPGNPFLNGENDFQISGEDTEDEFEPFEEGLSDCVGQHCSIGFRLHSGNSGEGHGIGVGLIRLQRVIRGTSATAFEDGTSMSAPHVAGVTALAWSIVPDKGYQAIRQAVLQSGDPIDALDGKTTTGRAVNAFKALKQADDPPTIALKPSFIRTTVGKSVTVAVQASDPDKGLPQKLTYSINPQPDHGKASLAVDHKSVTYTPDAGYAGDDRFGVKVDDGYTGTATVVPKVVVTESGGNGNGNGNGGGCVMSGPRAPFDPGFPLLIVVAGLYLGVRGRRNRRAE